MNDHKNNENAKKQNSKKERVPCMYIKIASKTLKRNGVTEEKKG